MLSQRKIIDATRRKIFAADVVVWYQYIATVILNSLNTALLLKHMANNRKEERLYTNNRSYHNPSEKIAWIFSSFRL